MRSSTAKVLQELCMSLLCVLPHAKANVQEATVPYGKTKSSIVIFLVFLLIAIILVLVYLYKKLNRETDGRYTITQLINGEGGVRERVLNGVIAVESRLGVRLRPRKREDIEGGEEEEEEEDKEEEDKKEDRASEKEADSLEEGEQRHEEDSSDDYSSLEGVDLRERQKLQKSEEAKAASEGEKDERKGEATGEKKEDKEVEGEEKNCKAGGEGAGLLADLKEFSGSAIWAEEKKEEEKDGDVTLL